MKVKELIELLKLENPESDIWVSDGSTTYEVELKHFNELKKDKEGEPVIPFYPKL